MCCTLSPRTQAPSLRAATSGGRIVKTNLRHGALAVAILFAQPTVWGHHSPTAIFHVNKRTIVTGTLVKVDWINPHIVILVDGQGRDGAVEHWKFQSNPPAWWRAVGVNRADVAKALGQKVVVEAQPAQDGSRYGYMRKLTFANGDFIEAVTTL